MSKSTRKARARDFRLNPDRSVPADKIRLIDALSETGLHHIQVCSFVNPRLVPGWADAEAVAGGLHAPKPGVHYTGLYFNGNGLDRALVFKDRLSISGSISLTASVGFTKKNLNRTPEENIAQMKRHAELHVARGIPVTRVGVMAAFGCNYQGDISPETVVKTLDDGMQIAAETGAQIGMFSLADTMGWATPVRIERTIGAVRETLAGYENIAASARYPRPRRGERPCGVETGRLPLRFNCRRPRWLPLRRPAQGRGQHLHRRTRVAV